MRAYSGDEEGLTALRDRLQTADAAMAARVKYYVGDVNDPAYLAEAMDGVDNVVYEAWTLNPETCEADPAEACMALLHPVNVVMDTAFQQRVKKLVVIGQDYTEPLSDTHNLILALLEKVVVAQARHQGQNSPTAICCTRMGQVLASETLDLQLIDFSIKNATNGDLLIQKHDGMECIMCENLDMKREAV